MGGGDIGHPLCQATMVKCPSAPLQSPNVLDGIRGGLILMLGQVTAAGDELFGQLPAPVRRVDADHSVDTRNCEASEGESSGILA